MEVDDESHRRGRVRRHVHEELAINAGDGEVMRRGSRRRSAGRAGTRAGPSWASCVAGVAVVGELEPGFVAGGDADLALELHAASRLSAGSR